MPDWQSTSYLPGDAQLEPSDFSTVAPDKFVRTLDGRHLAFVPDPPPRADKLLLVRAIVPLEGILPMKRLTSTLSMLSFLLATVLALSAFSSEAASTPTPTPGNIDNFLEQQRSTPTPLPTDLSPVEDQPFGEVLVWTFVRSERMSEMVDNGCSVRHPIFKHLDDSGDTELVIADEQGQILAQEPITSAYLTERGEFSAFGVTITEHDNVCLLSARVFGLPYSPSYKVAIADRGPFVVPWTEIVDNGERLIVEIDDIERTSNPGTPSPEDTGTFERLVLSLSVSASKSSYVDLITECGVEIAPGEKLEKGTPFTIEDADGNVLHEGVLGRSIGGLEADDPRLCFFLPVQIGDLPKVPRYRLTIGNLGPYDFAIEQVTEDYGFNLLLPLTGSTRLTPIPIP